MHIIKDKQFAKNDWTYIPDNAKMVPGNISVSLQRWCEEKQLLSTHQDQLGVRLNADDDVTILANDIDQLALIELNFLSFPDGRSFSHARLLRCKLNYPGEIRAVGHYIADQVFYLSRVGVNAFQMDDANELAVALSTLDDFSSSYQTSYN